MNTTSVITLCTSVGEAPRRGESDGSGGSLRQLEEKFRVSPSPVSPARHGLRGRPDNDVAGSREAFALSRGKVSGSRRKAEEGYITAFLAGEAGPTAEAAAMHLENFSVLLRRGMPVPSPSTALEVACRRPLRGVGPVAGVLREVRQGGRPCRGNGKGEGALRGRGPPFLPFGDYFALILDYADSCGSRGTPRPRRASGEAPGGRTAGVPFGGPLPPGTGRMEGGATRGSAQGVSRDRRGERFPGRRNGHGISPRGSPRTRGISRRRRIVRRLRTAGDDSIRQEARFRYAYGLYLRDDTTRRSRRSTPGRMAEAGRWSAPGIGTGRRGRFATPAGRRRRRRSSRTSPETRSPGSRGSSRFGAGSGTFRFLNAPSSGETKACGEERGRLWERIRKAAGGRPTPRWSGGRNG